MTWGSLALNSPPRLYDQYQLKIIGDSLQLTWLASVVESGWECSEPSKRAVVNKNKLSRNISRARKAVYEYAYCNEWDWFFTGTLDSEKICRSDLKSFENAFSQMVRDERKKGQHIKYLIVPELHADLKNWHCHGLIKGLSIEALNHFVDEKYNWNKYSEKFGFNSLEKIRCHEAVSKYLTKYISKTFAESSNRGVTERDKHLYLVSKGLKKGEVIKKGSIRGGIEQKPDFESEFCKVWNFDISKLESILALYDEADI